MTPLPEHGEKALGDEWTKPATLCLPVLLVGRREWLGEAKGCLRAILLLAIFL